MIYQIIEFLSNIKKTKDFNYIILNMKYKLKCLLHDKISFGNVG